ncbi:MAG: hypothetical protein WBX01_06400 [Nitrososphaeraceae archaeon]
MSMNPVPLKADYGIVKDFWRWVCGFPKAENPTIKSSGAKDELANNARKSNADFFYLSFNFSGPSRRLCTVRSGKKILIPSLSFIAVDIDFCEEFGSRISDLTRFAQIDHENIASRRITIDGITLEDDLDQFRVHTDPFEVDFPDNAIFGLPAGHSHAVADGGYLVLEELSSGKDHEIRFEGRIEIPETDNSLEYRTYEEDVTYTLKVI